MKSLIAAVVLGVVAVGAQAQMSPVGVWKTIDDKTKAEKAQVRVIETGGVLSGKIEKLLAPGANQEAKCDKCSDDRKDKPVIGMEIIRSVKKDGDVWTGGTILDSAEGKVYKVKMTPIEGGKKMEVRGYVGAPMFGRTQVWQRVE
ncbi:MAG: DUF2147 domain-containing protein [Burkholderiales bacterium]